jgi:hypothetical protein
MFLGVLAGLLAGCAYRPTPPEELSGHGQITIFVQGDLKAVAVFDESFEAKRLSNCEKQKPPEEMKARESGKTTTTSLYRCHDIDEKTLNGFVKQYLAALGSTAINMSLTTSLCDHTCCRWLNSCGPWKLNMACQQFCN